jgi:hypothetical protein
MSFAEKWMKLEIILLRKLCQTYKNKCHMFLSNAESTSKGEKGMNIKGLLRG